VHDYSLVGDASAGGSSQRHDLNSAKAHLHASADEITAGVIKAVTEFDEHVE
jgi:hypothetical protein